MKSLHTIRHSTVVPTETDKSPEAFSHRRAARAILTDNDGRIALLYVAKYGYHKLPGGGIEDGEDIAQALERELLEETGCQAQVTAELGKITEYRDQWDQKQTSYCYLSVQIGAIGAPDFTEKELSEGFAVVWAKDLSEAISLLEQDTPDDYGGVFIRERDLTFLRAAQQL